jgi:hypothetical protein
MDAIAMKRISRKIRTSEFPMFSDQDSIQYVPVKQARETTREERSDDLDECLNRGTIYGQQLLKEMEP